MIMVLNTSNAVEALRSIMDSLLAGITTTPPANQTVDVARVGGTAIATGTGTRSAGTQRVTVATDDVVPTIPIYATSPNTATFTAAALAAAQTVAATSTTRVAVLIENATDKVVYFKFGAAPAADGSNRSFALAAGAIYEVPQRLARVSLIAIKTDATGTGNVMVTSFT